MLTLTKSYAVKTGQPREKLVVASWWLAVRTSIIKQDAKVRKDGLCKIEGYGIWDI